MRFDFPGGLKTDFSALAFKTLDIQVILAHIANFQANHNEALLCKTLGVLN